MFKLMFTVAVYVLAGILITDVVNDYLDKLARDVAEIDERYCKRLFFHLNLGRDTPAKDIMVGIAVKMFWPVVCIAAIVKAEKEYDLIVRRSAWRRTP